MRALALGSFDGVHCGHQALLAATVAAASGPSGVDAAASRAAAGVAAAQEKLTPTALVIHDAELACPAGGAPHPPRLLSPARHEAELRAAGMRDIIHLTLDADMRALDPARFVDWLAAQEARVLLAGENFRFGRGRAGTAAVLAERGAAAGLAVQIVPLLVRDGVAVSSTRIRELLAAGEVAGAAELLGRPHELTGTVVHGAGRGRALGFPTVNLDCPSMVAPAYGVYLAAVAGAPGAAWALVSYGVRPTFAADRRGALLEAHLLDWQGDLYGRELTLQVVARLREERQYETISELIGQLHADAAQARELITTYAVTRALRRVTG